MLSNKDQNYRTIERIARAAQEAHSDKSELSDEALRSKLQAAQLVARGGAEPSISIGVTPELVLPREIRENIAALIGPQGYRSAGITALPLDRALTEGEFADIKDYFNLSYENCGVVDLARVERIFPDQRFYHSTNALTYALQREFGWLSPEDLAFVATELCGIHDYLEIDPGFFVGTDPTWVAGYGIPVPDSRPNDLLSILKIPLDHPEVHRLMRTSLFLEVDLSAYRTQLPSTDCFVIRQTDINRVDPVFEVIAPVAPMISNIRAVLDWNGDPAQR